MKTNKLSAAITKRTGFLYALLVFLILFQQSCKKADLTNTAITLQPKINLEKGFFQIPANTSATVKRIAKLINDQNNQYHFVNDFAARNGLAVWNKALIQTPNRNSHQRHLNVTTQNNQLNEEDTTVIIPLVLQNTEFVNAFLACSVGDSISIRLINANDYEEFGFHNIPDSISADKVALQTMLLELNVFDHREFHLRDQRLFNHTENGVTIHPEFCTLNIIDTSIVTPALMATVTVCLQVTVNGGWLTGCPPGGNCNNIYTFEICDNWNVWIDESSGGSSGSPCLSCIPWWGPSGGYGNSSSTIGWYYTPTTIFSNLYTPIDVSDAFVPSNDGITIAEMTSTPPPGGRIIGKIDSRGNTEDMEFGNNCNTSGILSNMPGFSDAQLFSEMNSLFHACTFFSPALQTVGGNMVDKFQNSTGGIFSDATLSQKAFESSSFKSFIKYFGGLLNNRLAAANWDITNVDTIIIPLAKRPRFTGTYHKFHGLQILINDTEETQIELNNFSINTITHKWTASITVTIKDHFGLDKNDALTYQDNHAGFAAWWILQHCRGYKPFETQLKIELNLIADPAIMPQD